MKYAKIVLVVLLLPLVHTVAISAQQACDGALPARLIAGGTGRVLYTDGNPLNVRESAGLSGRKIGQIPEGSPFAVLEGPTCVDEINWWHIDASGTSGWVAENAQGGYLVEPTLDVANRLDSSTVLAYLLGDTLTLARPDRTILQQIPVTPTDTYRFSSREVFYHQDGANILAVHSDGMQRSIPIPPAEGGWVDFLPAPDGSRIAWVFMDETNVSATAGGDCGQGYQCYDRNYTLLLTDGSGGQPRTLWTKLIQARVSELYLSLLSWRSDGQAVFLVRNPRTPSGDYPVMGDAIFEIPTAGGDVRTLVDNYLGITALAISPDGRWTAEDGATEGGYLPQLKSTDGKTYSVTQTAFNDNVQVTTSSQYLFSPDSQWFYWIEVHFDKTDLSAATTSMRRMSLADGSILTLAQFAKASPPTLPFAGRWLTNDLLVWQYGEGTFVYDMTNGQFTGWGLEGELSTLLGAIYP
jgi:hypothetical protein